MRMADKNQEGISGIWEPWHQPTLLPNLFLPIQPKNTDGTTKRHAHEREYLDEPLSDLQKSIKSLEKRLETNENPEQKAFLRKSIESFKEKYEKLKNEKMAAEIAEVSKDIRCERQKVEKLEEEKSENQKKMEQIEKEKKMEVSKLELRVQHLQKELDDQKSTTVAAQSEVESLKKETDRLKRRIEELEKEFQNTAIQSAQKIEKQAKEFIETERQRIEALTRNIEQSRAKLKEQEDDFKSQLQEKEDEILRVSNQLNEQQAIFEACLREKEQLQKNYDADMEKLMVAVKKQHNIESTLRSELKELKDTVTKIEADKRMEQFELITEVEKTKGELTETKEQLLKEKTKVEKLSSFVPEAVVPQQSSDDFELSLKLARIELENGRHKRELKDKERQIKEYEEEIILLRTQMSKSGGGGGIQLKSQCEELKQKLTEEEEKLTLAQEQYHELQLKYETDMKQLISEHSQLIASLTDEGEKAKGELTKAKEQFSKEKTRLEKQIKRLEQGETDRIKEMEEEIQTLTAQVNAYSREVDKQKGLVTQSQEKHKTEVIQLQEKLKSEIKSKTIEHRKIVDEKQQLVTKTSELERNLTAELKSKGQQQQLISELNKRLTNETKAKQQLAQQFDTLLANHQKLLTAYHEEQAMVTRLEDKIEKMKEANVVLRNKFRQQVNTDPRGIREPQHPHYPLPLSIAVRPNFIPVPDTDSNSISDDIRPQMSKEEMVKMFKGQGSSDYNQSPQQVEDSSLAVQKMQPTEESLVAEQRRQELARKVDDALLEVDRMRRQADLKQKSEHQQTNNGSDTQYQSRPKGQLTKEIEEMAEDIRKESRGPSTEEVLFNDDPNDDRPYDPNLVCPKCGKQYRIGEIQKLRRHMNEFCTGMR